MKRRNHPMRRSNWIVSLVTACCLALAASPAWAEEEAEDVCRTECDAALDACSEECRDEVDNDMCSEECLAKHESCLEECD
jgi:hypothetical protein